MLLRELISAINAECDLDDNKLVIEVEHLAIDSREVKSGSAFMALSGELRDGREFIPSAIEQGACAIFFECGDGFDCSDLHVSNVVFIGVENLSQKLGVLAAVFYQQPSRQMQLIGVTGTNGKTSISFLLAQLLASINEPCVIAGTLGNGLLNQLQPSPNTTADTVSLNALLSSYQKQEVGFAALEVSSHGIAQGRVNGLHFTSLIFSNLSHDHLDYHGDFASYGQVKLSLLTDWPAKSVVVDADDAFIQSKLSELEKADKKLVLVSFNEPNTTSVEWQCFWQIKNIQASASGCKAELVCYQGDCQTAYQLDLPVLGEFNVKNCILAVASLVSLGFDFIRLAGSIGCLELPPGRMQLLNALDENNPSVVVDYAHTPDALEQVLIALKKHVQKRLVCVFGCGGERDTSKRDEMGIIAERYADKVIVTNDNPRSESPEKIAADIQLRMTGQALVELDRKLAIDHAITTADAGDLILIAGKGHEQYQEINGVRHDFDDVALARLALEARHA